MSSFDTPGGGMQHVPVSWHLSTPHSLAAPRIAAAAAAAASGEDSFYDIF